MAVMTQNIQEFTLAITGNTSATNMTRTGPNGDTIPHGGGGLLVGVMIDLGTATTADITLTDASGSIIFAATSVVADTTYGPENTSYSVRPIIGVLKAAATNVSNSSTGTVTVRARVKK